MSEPPLEEFHSHRLLVAVDGSQASELAVRTSITAARRDHAAVTLITVVPDVVVSAGWSVAADPVALREQAEKEADSLLRRMVERLPPDLPVKTIMRHGKAGPEIVAHARERGDYDAILLGARGVGRVGALVGSVSSYVLHHAETTVIVVHPPREQR